MEDSTPENLTTRSLLKGILATEIVRPAVKKQTRRSSSRLSLSRIHQDKIPQSPSMSLRSQMKSRVRQSYGKQALENSYVKRNAKANTTVKSVVKGNHNVVDELNNITPQTLLKKIIQNEDEVSIIVSQRSKAAAAADHTEQEVSHLSKTGSLSSVNLSLADLQDTEPLDVFKISHKRKRMDISHFEREVDEKLPKIQDRSINLKDDFGDITTSENSSVKGGSLEEPSDISLEPQSTFKRALLRKPNKAVLVSLGDFEQGVEDKYHHVKDNRNNLKDNFGDFSSSENSSVKSRSFDEPLDLSREPQSTFKRALLRKPSKALVISLGDFEQGVEDKYHLLKGSQECFIESAVEDKSSVSTRTVEELNTELYVPPLLPDLNTSGKIPNIMSNTLVLSDQNKSDTSNMSLEKNSSINDQQVALSSIQTPAMIEERFPMVEYIQHTNRSIQKYLPMVEDTENVEYNQNTDKALSAVKKISPFASTQKQFSNEPVSMIESDKHSKRNLSTENVASIMEDSRHLQFQRLSKSSLISGEHIEPYEGIQKSELVGSIIGPFESNENKDLQMMEIDDAEHQPMQTVLSEIGEKHEISRQSSKIQNSKLKENINLHTESLSGSQSRPDNDLESSEDHTNENFLHSESSMEEDVASPEHQAKINKPSLIPALVETPAYIRNARVSQVIPKNKFAGKRVHMKNPVKTKKDRPSFKSSHVKQLFGLHAKMRVSKEASAEVEKLLEIFLDQMTDDLAAYSAHANRKTITQADLELLMKRQHLVTDTTSLNVLIERHLPMECRKLLIPCAMHGNQVFPKM